MHIHRISRRSLSGRAGTAPIQTRTLEATATDIANITDLRSYRDLQREAKKRGISAKQTADQLRKVLAEADDG